MDIGAKTEASRQSLSVVTPKFQEIIHVSKNEITGIQPHPSSVDRRDDRGSGGLTQALACRTEGGTIRGACYKE